MTTFPPPFGVLRTPTAGHRTSFLLHHVDSWILTAHAPCSHTVHHVPRTAPPHPSTPSQHAAPHRTEVGFLCKYPHIFLCVQKCVLFL